MKHFKLQKKRIFQFFFLVSCILITVIDLTLSKHLILIYIYISVGYSTCHWCHVMERESFVDTEIAKIMNENFINIKLDREERPDVDKLYMAFVVVSFFLDNC